MTTTTDEVGLGDGIYTVPEAARILRAAGPSSFSARRLRGWSRRSSTFGEHATSAGIKVYSFLDLVSLQVVSRLAAEGVRFSRIQQTEESLRKLDPDIRYPFAQQIFFTDGHKVWIDYQGNLLEVGGYPMQIVNVEAARPYLTEVSFDDNTGLAVRWDVNEWVEINPKVQFGRPVVRGTRVPVSTVQANLTVGSPSEVADWFDLDLAQVEGVRSFAPSN